MKLISLVILIGVKMIVAFQSKSLVFPRTLRSPFRSISLMSTDTTRTLAPGSHVSEMEVKKSRFLGYAQHAENWDQAQAYIQQVKAEHPKGRHWCYAVQHGVNPVSERCSDDGEPTGTAGVPILGKPSR
jgi:putative IMPACT (imprinted ancient) family translation regulator